MKNGHEHGRWPAESPAVLLSLNVWLKQVWPGNLQVAALSLLSRKEKLQGLTADESHLEVLEALGHEMFVQVSDDEVSFSKLILHHLASRVSVLASRYPSIVREFQRTEAAVYGLFKDLSLKDAPGHAGAWADARWNYPCFYVKPLRRTQILQTESPQPSNGEEDASS